VKLDEMLKAQLKLSLEVLSSTLSFLTSPLMIETLRKLCLDRDFYETVRRVITSVRALETGCIGASKDEMIRRMISEIKRCTSLDCVKMVSEEYERILLPQA